MSAPHPDGRGAADAIRLGLAQAGVQPHEVQYVNAHGTGTDQNDLAESRAIEATLGGEVPVSSTKGLTGHTLGACGAIEAVFTALTIQHGQAPASAGAQPLDPALGIQVLRAPSRRRVDVAVSNALAFGGSNIALVMTSP
jgi:3-oxoacyl-[acyl-carrier-protein] synthase II